MAAGRKEPDGIDCQRLFHYAKKCRRCWRSRAASTRGGAGTELGYARTAAGRSEDRDPVQPTPAPVERWRAGTNAARARPTVAVWRAGGLGGVPRPGATPTRALAGLSVRAAPPLDRTPYRAAPARKR